MFNLPMTNAFPILIIGMSFWAGIVHGCYKEPLHATYWIAAAILNLCVLALKEV